jgi:hypothetical protein
LNPPTSSLVLSRGVLACCLFDSDRCMAWAIEAGLDAAWFADAECRELWGECFKAYGNGSPIDAFRLIGMGKKPAWLDDSMDAASFTVLPGYIADLRRGWFRSHGRSVAGSLALKINDSDDPEASVAEAARELSNMLDAAGDDRPLDEIATALLDQWQARDDASMQTEITWPLLNMQHALGSVTDELIFLAAGESVGKTALALQFAGHIGYKSLHVALRSLESSKPKLVQRLIAQCGEVNTRHLRTGRPTTDEILAARAGVDRIKRLSQFVHINDRPATIEQLTAWGHTEKARGSKLLIVDNMKHVRSTRRFSSPVEEMRELSAGFKRLRDDVGLPVLVLHHTNAEGDVSWSRDIRRDTDILLIMSRDEGRSGESTADNDWCGHTVLIIHVEKNREGAAGFDLDANFDKATQTFKEVQHDGH